VPSESALPPLKGARIVLSSFPSANALGSIISRLWRFMESSGQPLILLDFPMAASYDNKAKQHRRGGCATTSKLAQRRSVAFCGFGVVTLCRFLGGLGDLG